jgi:hypothetical protein
MAFASCGPIFADTSAQHDVTILDKLDRGDFSKISDQHASRVDQLAVVNAFGKANCSAKNTSAADSSYLVTHLASYGEGGSDLDNQHDPAALLSSSDLATMFNPVFQATVAQISAQGCSSPRIQRIGRNLIKLLIDRMSAKPVPADAPLSASRLDKQTVVLFDQSDGFPYEVFEAGDSQVQDKILKQFRDLNASGARLVQCQYKGPGGYSSYLFWYKSVAIGRASLLQLSPKHPLSWLGDVAVENCPADEQSAVALRSHSAK